MTAPGAARAAVRAELTDLLTALGRPDAHQLSADLTACSFSALAKGGWVVVDAAELARLRLLAARMENS